MGCPSGGFGRPCGGTGQDALLHPGPHGGVPLCHCHGTHHPVSPQQALHLDTFHLGGLCPGGGDSHWAGAAEAPHRPAGGRARKRQRTGPRGKRRPRAAAAPRTCLTEKAGESLDSLLLRFFFSRAQDSRSSSWAMDFFPEAHLLAVVDHQAGHAHHLVLVPQGGKWFRS